MGFDKTRRPLRLCNAHSQHHKAEQQQLPPRGRLPTSSRRHADTHFLKSHPR